MGLRNIFATVFGRKPKASLEEITFIHGGRWIDSGYVANKAAYHYIESVYAEKSNDAWTVIREFGSTQRSAFHQDAVAKNVSGQEAAEKVRELTWKMRLSHIFGFFGPAKGYGREKNLSYRQVLKRLKRGETFEGGREPKSLNPQEVARLSANPLRPGSLPPA